MSVFAKIVISFIFGPKNNFKKRKYSPFDEDSNACFKNALTLADRELFEKNRF